MLQPYQIVLESIIGVFLSIAIIYFVVSAKSEDKKRLARAKQKLYEKRAELYIKENSDMFRRTSIINRIKNDEDAFASVTVKKFQ